MTRAVKRDQPGRVFPHRAAGPGDAAARRHEPGGEGIRRGAGPGRSRRADPVALRRRGGRARRRADRQPVRSRRDRRGDARRPGDAAGRAAGTLGAPARARLAQHARRAIARCFWHTWRSRRPGRSHAGCAPRRSRSRARSAIRPAKESVHVHGTPAAARRTFATHRGDAGRYQSGRRHLRRLDHVADGPGRRRLRRHARARPRRHRRGVQSQLPPAGESRRRGLRLYRHRPHRPHLDHAGGGGLGAAPRPGRAHARHRRGIRAGRAWTRTLAHLSAEVSGRWVV